MYMIYLDIPQCSDFSSLLLSDFAYQRSINNEHVLLNPLSLNPTYMFSRECKACRVFFSILQARVDNGAPCIATSETGSRSTKLCLKASRSLLACLCERVDNLCRKKNQSIIATFGLYLEFPTGRVGVQHKHRFLSRKTTSNIFNYSKIMNNVCEIVTAIRHA
jgi:hypothetical protein